MRFLASLAYVGLMTLLMGCEQRHLATDACINNLRTIDFGKRQWAMENGKTTNDVPTWEDLRPYVGDFGSKHKDITCPAGGTYTIGRVGEKPTCSIARHKLP